MDLKPHCLQNPAECSSLFVFMLDFNLSFFFFGNLFFLACSVVAASQSVCFCDSS